MAVTSVHSLYAAKFGATTIGRVVSQSLNLGTEIRGEPKSGQTFSSFNSIVAQKPNLSFSTESIAVAWAAASLLGLDLSSSTGLLLYLAKRANGGGIAAGSVHTTHTIRHGILVPQSLTMSHQGDASLSYGVNVTYDGTNNPILTAHNVALPTVATENQVFTLGKVTVGGILLTGVRSVEINFGIGVQTEGADSDIWDTHGRITVIKPVITIRGIDATLLTPTAGSRIQLTGSPAAHADTTIYLRKRSGTTYVADATAEHIKITADGLLTVDDAQNAQGSDAAESSATLTTKYDGTNDPILVTTNSAIV